MVHALMREYGYGNQPYFIYFHRDTDNNHVHILSTRVTPHGTLIQEHNDYRALNAALNRVLSIDQDKDKERMLAYNFTTEGQLMHFARMFNYKVDDSNDDGSLVFYHGGTEAFRIPREDIARQILFNQQDERAKAEREARAKQLKAIFAKYRAESMKVELSSTKEAKSKRAKNRKERMKSKSNPDVKRLIGAKGEPLTKEQIARMEWFISELHSKLGVAISFQKDRDGVVRGYTIVDHHNKVALNGSEVMKLAELIDFKPTLQKEVAKPKARVYQADSTLDIYRPIFQVNIDGKRITMSMGGKDYRSDLPDRWLLWYNHSNEAAREDVAIRLAISSFHREIYNYTLSLLNERYIREQPRVNDFPMDAVRLYKQSDGSWMLAVNLPGTRLRMLLTDEERREANQLRNSQDEFLVFKQRMLQEHLVREEARMLADRLHYNRVDIKPRNPHKEEGVQALVAAHVQLMQRLTQAFAVSTGHSQGNREWEVGGRFRYDDIDDERTLKR